MSLSAGRDTPAFAPLTQIRSYPVAASAKLYPGALVCLNSSGYAVRGATSTTLIAVGRCLALADNTGGSNGDINVNVDRGTFRWANGDSITLASVGALCYVSDDQTVTLANSSQSIAGTIEAVDSLGVWVSMGLQGPIDATALTAAINNYALTTSPGGASLVGVYDSATLLTATTVEAALAEVVKKANAGLAGPITFATVLSSAATNSVLCSFTPQFAGKIASLDACTRVISSTASKSVIFTATISGTATSGGALTVTTINNSTLGARITGTAVTGLNTFAAGDSVAIKVTSNGQAVFTEGEIILQLFLASA